MHPSWNYALAVLFLGISPEQGNAERRRAQRALPTDAPRVLLIGDSNMTGAFGRQLTADLKRLGFSVDRVARSGSGLARPDFYDWQRKARALVARSAPDVVILIFGGNDGQRLWIRGGQKRLTIPWGAETSWVREYRERVRCLAEILTMAGARLYVLSPTNRRPARARKRMLRILGAQRDALLGMPRVQWVNTFALTSRNGGGYHSRGPDRRGRRVVRYRYGDGIHMTPDGAAALRARLLPLLVHSGLATSYDTTEEALRSGLTMSRSVLPARGATPLHPPVPESAALR